MRLVDDFYVGWFAVIAMLAFGMFMSQRDDYRPQSYFRAAAMGKMPAAAHSAWGVICIQERTGVTVCRGTAP